MQGPLRGKRWIVGASTHGCWMGTYEARACKIFASVIKEGAVVFDVGAHVGYYSLVASETVGDSGTVFSFEPLPQNLYYMKKHIALNHIRNIKIIESAASDQAGQASFSSTGCRSMGRLSDSGATIVRTVTLDSLVDNREVLPPSVMKMDIEGAEFLALVGATHTLSRWHPAILLSTHGYAVHQSCCSFLSRLGYDLYPIDSTDLEEATVILAVVQAAADEVRQ